MARNLRDIGYVFDHEYDFSFEEICRLSKRFEALDVCSIDIQVWLDLKGIQSKVTENGQYVHSHLFESVNEKP